MEDPHMYEAIPPRDMYRMLKDDEADILLSGGRTQFIALKALTPWLDINQERHHAYAGYDGMVELVRQLDLALSNPMWAQVRKPAPWDADGHVGNPTSAGLVALGSADGAGETTITAIRKKFLETDAQDLGEC